MAASSSMILPCERAEQAPLSAVALAGLMQDADDRRM